MKLLIIEDNTLLAERLQKSLRRWYVIEIADSGDAALRLFTANSYDLILLDLGLPDANGRDICKHFRSLSKEVPILVVTGESNTKTITDLLNTGADDYMTKPFDTFELRARINALLRRRARSPQRSTITIGDLIITPSEHSVSRAGVSIVLRRKEFDILEYLALNPGRIMQRQNIIDHVWAATSTCWPGLVDVHIKQLRDKIDRPFKSPLIRTVYGVGYVIDKPRIAATKRQGVTK